MMCQRCHQTFSLIIRLIDILIWRQFVFLKSLVDIRRNLPHRGMCQFLEMLTLNIVTFFINTWEFGCKRQEIFICDIAMCQEFQQSFQSDCRTLGASTTTGHCLVGFCHANGIDEEEAILTKGIRCDIA